MVKDILKKLGRSFLIVAFLFTQSTVSLAQTANLNDAEPGTTKSKPTKRAKSKVIPSEQAIAAEIAFYSGDFAKASSLLETLSQNKDKDFALWRNQLGSIYLAAEDYKQALSSFLDAHYLMNDIAAFSKLESRAVALTGREREKAYKGDPYERVYNSLYVALLLHQEKDYDNSLAAVKNGLLCDSDVEGGLYKSDATLLYLLGARLEALRNNLSVSDEYLQKATEAYILSHPVNRGVVSDEQGKITLLGQKQKELEKLTPKKNASGSKKDKDRVRKPPKKSKKVLVLEDEIQKLDIAITTLNNMRTENNKQISTEILKQVVNPQNNVLFFVELGRGPVKYPIGQYGHIAIFTFKPARARNVTITVDKNNVFDKSKTLFNNDTFYQAKTRGGRTMDGILKGKAEFKQTTAEISRQLSNVSQQMSNQANQMQQQAAYGGTGGAAAAGAAYAAAGIALISLAFAIGSAMANPAADVRHWSLLPGEIQVVPMKISPGSHNIRLQVFDANNNEIPELSKEFDANIAEKDNIIIKRIVE